MEPKMAEIIADETKYDKKPQSGRFTGMTKLSVTFNLSIYADQELVEIALKLRANCKALLQRLLKPPNLRSFDLLLPMELELEDDLLNFVSLENFINPNYRNFMLDTSNR
ncbi:hypothetical protein L596_010625 [Steinernema carpocapsae]|uniref:Uncharacterized protein n=1 Tax=Steinernema carpocapsae TaxID=34508 RepID=A0A4U5PJ62_STECR|nr:hypothetical protein L596_010625 [Steinernema carpocapsae]